MGVGAGAKRRKDVRKDGSKKAINGEQRRKKGVRSKERGGGGEGVPRHRISELFRFADNFEGFDHCVFVQIYRKVLLGVNNRKKLVFSKY